jgi:phosphoglycerate dehydrogenase-like enzyme
MKVLVGVFSPVTAWTLPAAWPAQLRHDFPQHQFIDVWNEADLRQQLPLVDVAFTPYLFRDQVTSLTRLRWVQTSAAGVGAMMSAELIASPIVVTNARGLRAHAIAEHVIAVTLALARQLHTAMRRQVDRVWAVEELELGGAVRTLSGRHMVIVGLGSIGQEVARLASAFGLRVSGVRRQTDAPRPDGVEVVVPPGQLLQLLTTADVVVLAAPLTPATRGLLNRDALAACKRGAFLVNIGRGQLIDDEAVIAALNDGTLAGAALDVFAKEPLPPDSPYWDLPNTIVTPHVSGAMEDYWTPLVSLFAENLRRFEQGRPLLNLVDKRAGY